MFRLLLLDRDRCLWVCRRVLVCKYLCVQVHYLCVTDHNGVNNGSLWVFHSCSSDAQHPHKVVWLVICDAAGVVSASSSPTVRWPWLRVKRMSLQAYRFQLQACSLYHHSSNLSSTCLNYLSVILVPLCQVFSHWGGATQKVVDNKWRNVPLEVQNPEINSTTTVNANN